MVPHNGLREDMFDVYLHRDICVESGLVTLWRLLSMGKEVKQEEAIKRKFINLKSYIYLRDAQQDINFVGQMISILLQEINNK